MIARLVERYGDGPLSQGAALFALLYFAFQGVRLLARLMVP